jgi:starch synthase (maltosyl-transferring)
MVTDGRRRVVIDTVSPEIDGGQFPARRVVGERFRVRAGIVADGHDQLSAVLRFRKSTVKGWSETPMTPRGNDCWEGAFVVEEIGSYLYTVVAWVNHFRTWRADLQKRLDAGQDIGVELLIGAELVAAAAARAPDRSRKALLEWAAQLRDRERQSSVASAALSEQLLKLMDAFPKRDQATSYEKELAVSVQRPRASFSTWYEIFPRSAAEEAGRHGTFIDCERLLPEVARMGFDVLYFPPIHPIGVTNRKGKNNSSKAEATDVGSPWAIGSAEGGHKSIAPELGTLEDFAHFVKAAATVGIEVAIDLAFQASPDHPYVREHPEWFKWRPDGTVQYAENPPKRYEDVLPFNFETEKWRELWEELKSVVLFWVDRGIHAFRVDNPHTKPIAFWEWLIAEVNRDHPEVIFLAEAFTRPKVMYRLAKVGFTQSYTYFTWRNTKAEIVGYMTDMMDSPVREYFRPNFWPNTPDILPEFLQYGGRPAFMIRLLLAATLSSNYGIYGGAFELCSSEAVEGKEEYLNAEKYELKRWDWKQPGNLRHLISWVNRLRRENPALQRTWNLRFCETDNENLLAFTKESEDASNLLLIAVNLDPFHVQSGKVRVPLFELGIADGQPYLVRDLLSQDKYMWQSEWNYVSLDPETMPMHIFSVHPRMRREADFDYFM